MRLRLVVISAALFVASSALAAPPSKTRDDLICKAKSGLGFSYWWGNGAWCASGCNPDYSCGKGDCTPKPGYSGCPNCNHSGSKGADCSGYVARVWDVPSAKSISSNWHPYSTFNFYWESPHWDHINKSEAKKGDALTYRKLTSSGKDCLYSDSCSSGGHIVIYEKGDPYGYSYVNHAKGCKPDILYENKYIDSKYRARRRHNIVDGVCTPGQAQNEGCGNCGTRNRTCAGNSQWGNWSDCSDQGVCAKGAAQSQDCGDCGTKVRTCSDSCQWGAWGGCQNQGACAPGDGQTQQCGNCGSQSRSCSGDCQWGQWSQCGGQGPCSPQESGSQPCGDCGTQERTCSGQCQWNPWGACEGPDPEDGAVVCDAGLSGPCAKGRVRCVDGWLGCQSVVPPAPELCDGLDNDCDGVADNGQPLEIGGAPPVWAAELVDFSFPKWLGVGQRATVWVDFRNVGTTPWKRRAIWLALAPPAEEPSPFYDSDSWAAWDVAATLSAPVEPGEVGRFTFDLRAPSNPVHGLQTTLALQTASGVAFRCPEPTVHLKISVRPEDKSNQLTTSAGTDDVVEAETSSFGANYFPLSPPEPPQAGCNSASQQGGAGILILGLFCLLAILGRTLRRQ